MIARYAIPFFFLMGLVVVPLVVALICRWLLPRKYYLKVISVLTLLIWGLVGYGYFVGFEQLEIREIEYACSDLPEAFDGYRIVHFSDAHIGTYTGSRQWLLQRAVDTINALRPDIVLFTGDLQNVYPDELDVQVPILSQLKAHDGVMSVLGNHDYAVYQDCDESQKQRNNKHTIQSERKMGWTLLLNENRIIRRDSDSIVVAGMENWGKMKRMPRRGDVKKSLTGISDSAFVVMMQHDPTCWREKILPECKAQLTLSGHTHGGQVSLLGLSPASLSYDEWGGVYEQDGRTLIVSTGLGALIPFRLGMPGEIVVITLRKK
jgi:hypothetical protein